jgi:cephalosporin-C deacetylase
MPREAADQYVSKVRRPDDIDRYWEDVLSETALIPLEPGVTYDPLRSSERVDVYEVFFTSLDRVRIAGWYAVPREREGPLPGLLQVPGYNMEPPVPKNWANKGYATLSVAPRGKLRSNRQFNPGYPGLLTYGMVDRNTYSYRGFYMDACRGVEFLLSRDEVNGDRIGVTGHSQGGGLTVSTAALRPEIKAAAAGAPYLCGFMDAIELTDAYPYQEIADYLRMNPDSREQVENTLAYFDGINLAHRITCPIIVSVGLQDSTCPPETGFAMFDAIASADKRMYGYDGHGHDANNYEHAYIVDDFLAQHLQP